MIIKDVNSTRIGHGKIVRYDTGGRVARCFSSELVTGSSKVASVKNASLDHHKSHFMIEWCA